MSENRFKSKKKRLMIFNSPTKDEIHVDADLLAVTYTDDVFHLHFAKMIQYGKQPFAQVVGEVTTSAEGFQEFIKHLNAFSEKLGRTNEAQREGLKMEWSHHLH